MAARRLRAAVLVAAAVVAAAAAASTARLAALDTMCRWVAAEGGSCSGVRFDCDAARGCFLVAARSARRGSALFRVPTTTWLSWAGALQAPRLADVLHWVYNGTVAAATPPVTTRRLPFGLGHALARMWRATAADGSDAADPDRYLGALLQLHYEAFVAGSASVYAPFLASLPQPPTAVGSCIAAAEAATAAGGDDGGGCYNDDVLDVGGGDAALLALAAAVPSIAAAAAPLLPTVRIAQVLLLQHVICRFPRLHGGGSSGCLLTCATPASSAAHNATCRAAAAALLAYVSGSSDTPAVRHADATYRRWMAQVVWTERTHRSRSYRSEVGERGTTMRPVADMVNHVSGATTVQRYSHSVRGERDGVAAVEYLAATDLSAGSEVVAAYATDTDACAARMLVTYGFVPAAVETDDCAVTHFAWSPSKAAAAWPADLPPATHTRLLLLLGDELASEVLPHAQRDGHGGLVATLQLASGDGVPESVVVLARLAALSDSVTLLADCWAARYNATAAAAAAACPPLTTTQAPAVEHAALVHISKTLVGEARAAYQVEEAWNASGNLTAAFVLGAAAPPLQRMPRFPHYIDCFQCVPTLADGSLHPRAHAACNVVNVNRAAARALEHIVGATHAALEAMEATMPAAAAGAA